MTDTPSLVPIWPKFVLPTLKVLSDGQPLPRKAIYDAVAHEADVNHEARSETLKTGGSRFEQRVGWALSNLLRAQWIDRPSRGVYVITEAGRAAIEKYPEGFTYSLAKEVFTPYWPKRTRPVDAEDSAGAVEEEVSDPVEEIANAVERIEAEVGGQLLERLRDSHPDFFEQAVVELLLKMGYGGAAKRGRRIGGSNDEGVDGLIDQDLLGLDQVYIQAKRYKQGNNVGREAIQAFVGALHGFGATRGVFLTTSEFTAGARSYAQKIPSRIILIDGARLVELMIAYRIGVQEQQTFSVVEIDEDYFA